MRKTNDLDELQLLKTILDRVCEERSFATCIKLAFHQFGRYFFQKIRDLIFAFPEDAQNEDPETGESTPFWFGSKRFPQAVEYNLEDSLQVSIYFSKKLTPVSSLSSTTVPICLLTCWA